MTLQISPAGRSGLINGLVAAIGASPTLQIRSGLPPANTAAAAAGTVLASPTLPATWMGAAVNGVASKQGTWDDTSADASGYAGHYRILASDGAVHLQGLVSEPWSASKAYVVGQQVHLGGNVYRATAAGTSASSGGPTGTGTGITDGGVTWAYVGSVDMTLDNTNLATGQDFLVSAYSLSAANA